MNSFRKINIPPSQPVLSYRVSVPLPKGQCLPDGDSQLSTLNTKLLYSTRISRSFFYCTQNSQKTQRTHALR